MPRTLAVLLAPLFMYQADIAIVNVANPAIDADLDASGAQLQLVIGGCLLGSAALLITGARLGQMHGYGLLFSLALYLQQHLGASPFASGLTLVSWVAAFGILGRLMTRVPRRLAWLLPPAGCVLLAAGYAAISASMFAGRHPEGLLIALLGVGGFGLGTTFSSILGQLTAAATPRYAADISGVFTTSLQVAGAIGVAVFGTAYLALDRGDATHAFAVITAVFAATALIAGAVAYRATRSSAAVRGTVYAA